MPVSGHGNISHCLAYQRTKLPQKSREHEDGIVSGLSIKSDASGFSVGCASIALTASTIKLIPLHERHGSQQTTSNSDRARKERMCDLVLNALCLDSMLWAVHFHSYKSREKLECS